MRDALEEAREEVAGLLGAVPRQVVFTSGATEAINAAVWGACRDAPGAPVLCAAVEHSAVRDASARLAPVETLPVDGTGRLDVEVLHARLRTTALPRPRSSTVNGPTTRWARCSLSTKSSRSAAKRA